MCSRLVFRLLTTLDDWLPILEDCLARVGEDARRPPGNGTTVKAKSRAGRSPASSRPISARSQRSPPQVALKAPIWDNWRKESFAGPLISTSRNSSRIDLGW